jgi:hypothetical protein
MLDLPSSPLPASAASSSAVAHGDASTTCGEVETPDDATALRSRLAEGHEEDGGDKERGQRGRNGSEGCSSPPAAPPAMLRGIRQFRVSITDATGEERDKSPDLSDEVGMYADGDMERLSNFENPLARAQTPSSPSDILSSSI